MKRPLCCLAFMLLIVTYSFHFFGVFSSFAVSLVLCGGVFCSALLKKEVKILFLVLIILTSTICTLRIREIEKATELLTDNVVDVNITVYEASQKAKTTKVTAKGIIDFKEKKYKFGETKLYLRGDGFEAGDTISFKALFSLKNNSGLLFEPQFSTINAIKVENKSYFSLYGFFGEIRKMLSDEALNVTYGEETRLFPALLTGDKKYLTVNQQKIITNGGISHLVAVSGMHLAVLVSFLSAFLKDKKRKTRFLIKNFACLFMAGASGFSPSVMRAWVMFFISDLGELLGRKTDTVTSLGTFSIIMCLFFPKWLFRLATWLSFFAVLGITLFSDWIVSFFKFVFKFNKKSVVGKLFQLLAISISANLATMPIVALSFGYFPFWSLASNFFLMGIVAVMLTLLWVSVGISLLFNIKIVFLCRLLAMTARMVFRVAEFFGNLPPRFVGIDENYIKVFLVVSVVTLLCLSACRVLGERLLFSALMFLSCCFFMVSLNTFLNFDKAHIILTNSGCSLMVKGKKAIMLGNVEDSYEEYQLASALKRLNVHKIEAVILDSYDIPDINLYNLMVEFGCDTVVGQGISYKAFCKWGNWQETKLKEDEICPLGIKGEIKDSEITFFFKEGSLLKTMGKCDIIAEDCTIRELQEGIFCTKFCIGE